MAASSIRLKLALAFALAFTAWPVEFSRADVPVAADSRDMALLARMTLAREGQPAHAAQQGHDDRPRLGGPA